MGTAFTNISPMYTRLIIVMNESINKDLFRIWHVGADSFLKDCFPLKLFCCMIRIIVIRERTGRTAIRGTAQNGLTA